MISEEEENCFRNMRRQEDKNGDYPGEICKARDERKK